MKFYCVKLFILFNILCILIYILFVVCINCIVVTVFKNGWPRISVFKLKINIWKLKIFSVSYCQFFLIYMYLFIFLFQMPAYFLFYFISLIFTQCWFYKKKWKQLNFVLYFYFCLFFSITFYLFSFNLYFGYDFIIL